MNWQVHSRVRSRVGRRAGRLLLAATTAVGLSACGGGGHGDSGGAGGPPPGPVSFVGTTGVFAAWANPVGGTTSAAPVGSYAGKKQVLHGVVDFMDGRNLGQPAGIEVYKASDGHVYAVDLTSTQSPVAQQLSSETAATIDDTCTLSGTIVPGANYDYVGVYFTADLVDTTNSTYIYRLPGADGTCNTADDQFHMVKTGMSATDAPITVSAMPVATVRTPSGGISGFVIKSGASLVLVDGNFANPVVLCTFTAPIGVAVALPVGTTQGYPTGQLYVVDGSIYYVNYASPSISAALTTIPGWLPTNAEALFAASPTTLYVSIYTPAAGAVAASSTIYAIPADGSAAAAARVTEPGHIETLLYPVQGSDLLYGVANPDYAIRALPDGSTQPATLVASTQNSGTFIATAATVYYETWTTVQDNTAKTITRSQTTSGIVGVNGTAIQSPLAGSTFVNGGEQVPWPNDTTTTQTPYETVFQVQGLSTVTVTDPINGYTYTVDGVGGGSVFAIDATSNQVVAETGQLPSSTASTLSGTFRGTSHVGFLEAASPASTEDPATRDLYILDSQSPNSLQRLTSDL